MPYKIYTYEDPYKIDQTDFWNEISMLPHFCVSRTLVNGLKDVMQDSIRGLICPLDNLVDHQDVFQRWTNNISLQVQQYSALTAIFNRLVSNGRIDENFYMALVQNQTHFLEAIRLFVELGIPASSLDSSKGNQEQKLFVDVLTQVQKEQLFQFPETPNKEKLKSIIDSLAVDELDDYYKKKNGTAEGAKWYNNAIKVTKQQPLNAIVVHGVHQFKPAQLRLLLDMEKMGVTIIFLFNYQHKYSAIYSSWIDIYGCFEVPIRHDQNVKEYCIPTMQNQSNALACAIGELCEGRKSIGHPLFRSWYKLYSGIDLMEFANITEYAHFVSNHFDAAIHRYSESRSVMDRGNDIWSNVAVLRFLDEQVYTANRDVHTLLKIYFPEYAKDRHFLSYPIGQFFSAIYRLWDYERHEIIFDIPAIKECLSSNILKAAPGEELLKTFYNLEILFEHITTFADFEKEVAKGYLEKYERVTSAKGVDPVASLRSLSIYNKYKIRKKDILTLVRGIEEINEIASYLFAIDNSHDDFINFGKHFHKLEEFLKQHEMILANEQERTLINALQIRLNQIHPEKSTFSGTFHDLKEGLYYYLKQKDADEGVDWIVKNFEQIDGDILQSKRQFDNEEKKVYHFACLSDRDMNKTVDELLPWPLSEAFIHNAYAPIDLQFQVYYSSIGERSSFLRYALFYGLCFNRCDVRLSYVKQYGDETSEPYALLSLLGLEAKGGPVEEVLTTPPVMMSVGQEYTKGIKYDRFQMMDMFLCPYRYFLDYVMEDSPVFQGSFLYQKFYENYLVDAVWQRVAGQPCSTAMKGLPSYIDAESAKVEDFFPFWKRTEIHDLKLRARNYLANVIIGSSSSSTVRPYAKSHMQMRRLFGLARYDIDISDKEPINPYMAFEKMASRKYPKKSYSLHSLPKSDQQPTDVQKADVLREAARQYVNQTKSKDKTAIASEWCTYCVHKGTCMEPFLNTDSVIP